MWEKEKELRQLQEQEETATDAEVKRALQYMIGVTVEALKLHLNSEWDDLPGLSKLLVAERATRALDMKWLSSQQAQRVTSVWAPMPYPFDGYESDKQDIFITKQSPRSKSRGTSSQPVQGRNSKKRPAQTSTPVSKKGRITHFFRPSQQ